MLDAIKWVSAALAVASFAWGFLYIVRILFLSDHRRRLKSAGDDEKEEAVQKAAAYLRMDVSWKSAADQFEAVTTGTNTRFLRFLKIWICIEIVWALTTFVALAAFVSPDILGFTVPRPN